MQKSNIPTHQPKQAQKPNLEIWLEVIVTAKGNAIPLEAEEHRSIPCHYLKSELMHQKFFRILYRPANAYITENDIIKIHIAALRKIENIVSWRQINRFKVGAALAAAQ